MTLELSGSPPKRKKTKEDYAESFFESLWGGKIEEESFLGIDQIKDTPAKEDSALSLNKESIPKLPIKRKRERSSSPAYTDLTSGASEPSSSQVLNKKPQFSAVREEITTVESMQYTIAKEVVEVDEEAIGGELMDIVSTKEHDTIYSENESYNINSETNSSEKDFEEEVDEEEEVEEENEEDEKDEEDEEDEEREEYEDDLAEIDELDDSSDEENYVIEKISGASIQNDISISAMKNNEKEIEQPTVVDTHVLLEKKTLHVKSLQEEAPSIDLGSIESDLSGMVEENDFDQFPSLDVELLEKQELLRNKTNATATVQPVDDIESNSVSSVEEESASEIPPSNTTPAVNHIPDDNDDSDDDDDVFYDVEYVDIDKDGNLTGSQSKPNESGSLDLFKEGSINESQIIKAYQDLEADPLEKDVQTTQVKDVAQDIDLDFSPHTDAIVDDIEEDQSVHKEALSNKQDIPENSQDNSGVNAQKELEDTIMADTIDVPSDENTDNMDDFMDEDVPNPVDIEDVQNVRQNSDEDRNAASKEIWSVDSMIEAFNNGADKVMMDVEDDIEYHEDSDDMGEESPPIEAAAETRHEEEPPFIDLEEEAAVEMRYEDEPPSVRIEEEVAVETRYEDEPPSIEHVEEAAVEIRYEDEPPSIEHEEEPALESRDEEELPFSLPESLPSLHENVQITPEHWRGEEEMPLSVPESLPIPHENTQITLEHWRDEEMKLENSYEPPCFTDFNKKTVQLKEVIAADKSLTMWWYDALEENKKTIFLFGKVFHAATDKYVSCCVIVENLQREVYVLPRQHKLNENGDLTDEIVTLDDVKKELAEKLASKEINQYTMEICTKKYAFELPDIPPEAEYVKLTYPFREYRFPPGTTGKTFSHMFGTSVSPIEHFIIRQKLMGPCWLKFNNVERTMKAESWCAVEALVANPDNCTLIQDDTPADPPLTIMSLSVHACMNNDTQSNEISGLGGFVCPDTDIDKMDTATSRPFYRFAITTMGRQRSTGVDNELPLFHINKQETERDLLYAFLAQIQMIDPDIIIGHNFTGVDLDILLHRMKKLNILNWSRIGRRRRERWPKLQAGAGGFGKSTFSEQLSMCGRLLCDTYLASQDLVKSKSYNLTQLATSQLSIIREDFEKRDSALYDPNGSEELEKARHCSFDAYLAFALAIKLQILPLAKKLTSLSGNLWSRSMNGGRSERNEYLLLHQFTELNYICPDKPLPKKKNSSSFSPENEIELEASLDSAENSSTPSYAGGLVLEPKIGFYDKYVLLLDFNSLYPSIMQEYNICFTTVERKPENLMDYREVPPTPEADCPEGILPGLVRLFVQRRQHVKKLMKNHTLSKSVRMQYDIEQMALKLTANSMYGCLGSSISRFYARPLAMLITYKGREILRSTVDSAESLGFNVIYGDTDSIMIHTNETKLSKVKKIGEGLKEHVNKKYNLLEIDVDGYFRHTLLLKKKKYAALLVKQLPTGILEESVEAKGLDLVRRDWCELSRMVSKDILDYILSDEKRENVIVLIYRYLKNIARNMRKNKYNLSDYIIQKQLTKNLEEYNNRLSHPHVHVAKEMRRKGLNIKSGDVVPYVICTRTNEAGKSFNEPCIPEACSTNQNGQGKIDVEWYLSKQILPPVNRLCGPIEGIDLDSLIKCVGLTKEEITKKAKLANTHSSQKDEEVDPDLSIYMEDSRYLVPETLYLNCSKCFFSNKYTGPIKIINEDKVMPGLECENCGCELNPANVKIKLQLSIIRYINRYYSSGFVCDQVDCDFTTPIVPLHTTNCPSCAGGLVREYSAKMLYMQLFEILKLFDIERIDWDSFDPVIQDTLEYQIKSNETYGIVKGMVDAYLKISEYNFIDMTNILQA